MQRMLQERPASGDVSRPWKNVHDVLDEELGAILSHQERVIRVEVSLKVVVRSLWKAFFSFIWAKSFSTPFAPPTSYILHDRGFQLDMQD